MLRPAIVIHGGAGTADLKVAPHQRAGAVTAITAGWAVLEDGGTALDAVCAAVVAMENEPVFNAGYGSCLTSEGTVEMDASLMDGATLHAGAVAVVRRCRNPIELARAVMQHGRHLLIAGRAADELAAERGLPMCQPEELITTLQRLRWQRRIAQPQGTVGAVAIDRAGHVAAATSTGGLMGKLPGRIGDSAVIGAGTYADDGLGAASATGIGEAIIRLVLCKGALDRLAPGGDPQTEAERAMVELEARTGGNGGMILVDRFGRIGAAHNAPHMTWGFRRGDMEQPQVFC